jgi:probable FeS assembly SUF system protein SufT
MEPFKEKSEEQPGELRLARDCPAVQIPQGNTVTLPAGTLVTIEQSLGGSFTIMTADRYLFRIADSNADALGLAAPATGESEPSAQSSTGPAELDEAAVWDQLKTCYDPEIPVNIVDLGLIYDCAIERQENGQALVRVRMTLTAPGCGMGPVIASEAQMRIESLPGVQEACVELVWDPPWDQSMISEEGKMKLGLI